MTFEERMKLARETFVSVSLKEAQNDLIGYLASNAGWDKCYICIDIAPGVELFHALSEQPEKAREFFLKHKTRSIFGTDIGLSSVASGEQKDTLSHKESAVRAELCKRFLSENGEFVLENDRSNITGAEDDTFHGLGLDEETQQLICRDNFLNFVGKAPKRVIPRKVISMCKLLRTRLMQVKMADEEKAKQVDEINSIIWFFSNITKKDKNVD